MKTSEKRREQRVRRQGQKVRWYEGERVRAAGGDRLTEHAETAATAVPTVRHPGSGGRDKPRLVDGLRHVPLTKPSTPPNPPEPEHGGQRTEDGSRSEANARRLAVCEALTHACAGCRLLTERRGTSDERRCPAACCANCRYAGRMRDGDTAVPVCVNTPNAPGEIVRIDPQAVCPNFRRQREPVVHGTPPEPPNDNIRYIPLTRGLYAIVDAADYEWLSQYKWCVIGAGRPYACRRENGKTIYMHREIMQARAGLCVDHIEGFTLDNRRANLRTCTVAENMRNRRGNSGRDLPKGVTWQKHANKYRAGIAINGKPMHIGYYDDPIEAAKAYDRKARELFGEFARLNFPDAVRQESVARPSSPVSRAAEGGGEQEPSPT